jgi:hypothetical protein
MKLLGGSATVYGQHFAPGKTVTITFKQGLTSQAFTVTAGSDGTFAKVITTPLGALVGSATITACDPSNPCASQTITITLT